MSLLINLPDELIFSFISAMLYVDDLMHFDEALSTNKMQHNDFLRLLESSYFHVTIDVSNEQVVDENIFAWVEMRNIKLTRMYILPTHFHCANSLRWTLDLSQVLKCSINLCYINDCERKRTLDSCVMKYVTAMPKLTTLTYAADNFLVPLDTTILKQHAFSHLFDINIRDHLSSADRKSVV